MCADDGGVLMDGNGFPKTVPSLRIIRGKFCLLFPYSFFAHEDVGRASLFSSLMRIKICTDDGSIPADGDGMSELSLFSRVLGDEFCLFFPFFLVLVTASKDVRCACPFHVANAVEWRANDGGALTDGYRESKPVLWCQIRGDEFYLLSPISFIKHRDISGASVTFERCPGDSNALTDGYGKCKPFALLSIVRYNFDFGGVDNSRQSGS